MHVPAPAGREKIEPGARLVAERPPEIAHGPIAGGVAAEERHIERMAGHVRMRNAFLGKDQMLHVVVVDDHGAVGAEQLDAIRLALRRIIRRQRVADAEIDHGAVGEGDDRPGHVVGAIAGVAKNAGLAARHDFDRPVALEEPAHQVDVIGEHVEHRRGVRIALEDGESLGARIIDARQAAADVAEPAVHASAPWRAESIP